MSEVTASNEEIVFLCLARDCEQHLPQFFGVLEGLRSAGMACSAIIGENGSRDRTRDIIEKASGFGISLLDTSGMAAASGRLARMAVGRQMLLDALQQIASRAAFVCVADLDNVMEKPPTLDSIRTALQRLRQDRTVFGISATSRPVYYDLLALRAPGYDFSSLNAEIAAAKKHPLTYYQFHEQRIYKNQRAFTSSQPVVCSSTFNGFCLYRMDDYLRGTYRGAMEANICEHVTLNLSIGDITGRQMLIAPDLVVRTPKDHAPVNFARFWWDRVRDAVARRG